MVMTAGTVRVLLTGDSANLEAAVGRTNRALSTTAGKSAEVGGAMGGLVREGMGAERGLQRVEFAMTRIVETGDLSMGSLRGLTLGLSRLAPAIFPIIGVITTVILTLSAWKKANEEAQAAADASAASWEKWLAAHAKPVATPKSADPRELLHQQEEQLRVAEQQAVHYNRLADIIGSVTTVYSDYGIVLSMLHPGSEADKDAAEKQAEAYRSLAAALRVAIATGRRGLAGQDDGSARMLTTLRAEGAMLGANADQERRFRLEQEITAKHWSAAQADRMRAQLDFNIEYGRQVKIMEYLATYDTRAPRAARDERRKTLNRPRDMAKSDLQPDKELAALKATVRASEAEGLKFRDVMIRTGEQAGRGMIEAFITGSESMGQALGKALARIVSEYIVKELDRGLQSIMNVFSQLLGSAAGGTSMGGDFGDLPTVAAPSTYLPIASSVRSIGGAAASRVAGSLASSPSNSVMLGGPQIHVTILANDSRSFLDQVNTVMPHIARGVAQGIRQSQAFARTMQGS